MSWTASLAGEHPQGNFMFSLETDLPQESAWRSVVDVSRHGDVVPMTRGQGPPPEALRSGHRVVASTGVGRWTFDDVMVVREVAAPSRVAFEKIGRPLHGLVQVHIQPVHCAGGPDTGGCVVVWSQTFSVPWIVLPRPLAQLVGKAMEVGLSVGYRSVVARLLTGSRAAN